MSGLAAVALTLWGAQSLASTLAVAAYRRGLPRPEIPGVEPRVAVILPVKGAEGLADLLPRLRAQAYGPYRIIASVESERDPAFARLRAAAAEPGAPLEVTVAGLAENAGQKVWSLGAALGRLAPDDEVVAFLDADTLPTPLWLPRLIAVLVNSGRPVATGYRWMAPADARWSSVALAAANNGVASLPRTALPTTMVWGGSVAMRRATLETLRLPDYWRGAISDDLQMAEALRRAGVPSYAPRQALLLTPVSASWRDVLAFGVRQYRLVYMHRPARWAVAAGCLWAPILLPSRGGAGVGRGVLGGLERGRFPRRARRGARPVAGRHRARVMAGCSRTAGCGTAMGRAADASCPSDPARGGCGGRAAVAGNPLGRGPLSGDGPSVGPDREPGLALRADQPVANSQSERHTQCLPGFLNAAGSK